MIKEIYTTFKDKEERRGLSEERAKKKLEKEGWLVWRGELIGILRRGSDIYPNVLRKYQLFESLMEKHHPQLLEELQYLSAVHHGMPDYVAFREGQFKFVECKIGYEALRPGQKKTIARLINWGFTVEIHRLAEPQQKTRIAEIDHETHARVIKERQKKLRR
jgi:hypothetical protein